MIRKQMMLLAMVAAAFGEWAATETVCACAWTCQFNGGMAGNVV